MKKETQAIECNPKPARHVKVEPIRFKLNSVTVKTLDDRLKKIYKVQN